MMSLKFKSINNNINGIFDLLNIIFYFQNHKMAFVKVVKNKAYFMRFQTKFKRRR